MLGDKYLAAIAYSQEASRFCSNIRLCINFIMKSISFVSPCNTRAVDDYSYDYMSPAETGPTRETRKSYSQGKTQPSHGSRAPMYALNKRQTGGLPLRHVAKC